MMILRLADLAHPKVPSSWEPVAMGLGNLDAKRYMFDHPGWVYTLCTEVSDFDTRPAEQRKREGGAVRHNPRFDEQEREKERMLRSAACLPRF
jgi:hypothetical protein